jgi:hypothetical protein
VLAGLAVILTAFLLALGEYSKAADVSTALAPVTGVVGTLVGAYFGVQVGSAGKERAEDAREKSEQEAKAALAALPPDRAEAVRMSLG